MSQKNDEQKQEYWRASVEELSEDSTHGSIYLADRSLAIIQEFVERQDYRNRTELLQNLSKLSNALVRAKPLMALIYTTAQKIIESIQAIPKDERDINVIKNRTLQTIEELKEETNKKQQLVTRYGARLFLEKHEVLVHSASSVVESILLEAHRLKKRFKLICTESRPLFEGTQLAHRMAQAGIKTRLIPDADITRAVQDAHFVLTGTDRITENTFINKTGTAALGVLTKEFNKPFYIAADTGKILLKRVYPTRFHSVHEEEIFKNPPEYLTIENIYFEEIPLAYIHKIICEDGIYELKEFQERYL